MISRLFRLIGTALIVATIAGTLRISPAFAAIGDTPDQAEALQSQSYTTQGQIRAGQSYWYFVDYPGNGLPLGITLHLRSEMQPFRNQVELNVNVRSRGDVNIGEKDKDGPGVSRIGALSNTDDSGLTRKFWLNFSGDGERYFLRLNNFTDRTVSYVITVERSLNPASYVEPPVPQTTVAPPPQPVPQPIQPAPQPIQPLPFPAEPAPVPTVVTPPPAVAPPFITGGGTSPSDAEALPSQSAVKSTYVGPGQVAWFRVDYSGSNVPLGVTLLLRPSEEGIRDSVSVAVNVRSRPEALGETDKDWPGFTRLGTLSQTDNSGTLRKFWLNSSGSAETYYLRVANDSDRGVVIALTVQRSFDPAPYFVPPDPSSSTP